MKLSVIAWGFVAPALLVIGTFFVLPVFTGLALSLTDFDIYALADLRNLRFVGLDNYLRLLRTPLFWQALGNTFYFVVVGVPLSIALSLGSALLLHARVARFKCATGSRSCTRGASSNAGQYGTCSSIHPIRTREP